MCNINKLPPPRPLQIWLLAWLGLVAPHPSCSHSPSSPPPSPGSAGSREAIPAATSPRSGPALPLDRIAIVGASISAGFGGTPFGDAFAAAAPRSKVTTAADVMLFRDPVGNTTKQLAVARDFKATTVLAVDLLFWHVYGFGDRSAGFAATLDALEALRAAGTWIVIGDIPLITTASELLLAKEAIPSPTLLGSANEAIRAFATRERVLLVPLGEWTEPLRAGAEVMLSTGEKVAARSLMALDGLHANPLGVWYLLDRLDHYIEEKLPGTSRDALRFERPPAQ